jgi:hypothetical protein
VDSVARLMTVVLRTSHGLCDRACATGLALLIVVSTAACGYAMAGTWEDDPGNWSRAFQTTKPPEVRVIHSKYWRAPHWTYEFEYFFEIAPDSRLKAQLFGKNKLRQATGTEANQIRKNDLGDAPSWFAPGDATEYEVWVYEGQPASNFRVLIDKTSGVMFLADYQV